MNLKNYNYWQAGKTWEEMINNEGHDGGSLTMKTYRGLQKEWPQGFYIQGWKKGNDNGEPDGYMTPDETRKQKNEN